MNDIETRATKILLDDVKELRTKLVKAESKAKWLDTEVGRYSKAHGVMETDLEKAKAQGDKLVEVGRGLIERMKCDGKHSENNHECQHNANACGSGPCVWCYYEETFQRTLDGIEKESVT